MAYTPRNPNGQATKANSEPVVIASDQMGTAGTPAADVLSVQGVSGGTALLVTGTGGTFPVTLGAETTKVIGTVRLTDGTGNLLTTNSTTPSGKYALDHNIVSILGTAPTTVGYLDVILKAETTKVLGTVRLADGAGGLLTSNSSVITSKFALDVNLLSILGTALTSTVAGKIDVSASGFAASGATKVGNPVLMGGAYTSTQPTVTTGQVVDAQMTARGAQIVATGVDTFNVTTQPGTSGGWSTDHYVSAASTNARSIKASAGQVGGWYIYNSASTAIKVVLHNTAGTPTAGASVFLSIPIPPLSAANVEFTQGIAFSSGIGMTIVTGLADNNASAVAANDIVSNIFYK